MIGDEPPLKPLIDIPRMAEITIEMIHKGLQSFLTRDVEQAKRVASMDNVVDGLQHQVFSELLTKMMVDPKAINRATRLLWVSHNLERAADRATNICERVVFTVTGKMEELGARLAGTCKALTFQTLAFSCHHSVTPLSLSCCDITTPAILG
jgi:phosphate transport system protein